KRKLKGASLDAPIRAYARREGLCAVDGCERDAQTRGYCQMHYARIIRRGEPGPAQRQNTGLGSGYIRVTVDGQFMLERRYVMEVHLGRPLWPDEQVHHRNRRRHDNRIENLELWTTAQPSGGRVEDLVRFYVERYPEEARKVLDALG